MSGWVKLHRRLRDNPVLRDFDAKGVWSDLLLMAQHKPYPDRINGQDIVLQRGQLALPVSKWCEQGGLTRKRIRTILASFVKQGMIEMVQAKGHAATIITICNYELYQARDDAEGQAKGQERAKQGPTIRQEGKNLPSPSGEGPKPARSLKGLFWDELVAHLDMPERAARRIVGDWVSAHGIGKVFEAHDIAKDKEPADYRSYMYGVLNAEKGRGFNGKRGSAPVKAARVQAGEHDPLADEHLGPFPLPLRTPQAELGAR